MRIMYRQQTYTRKDKRVNDMHSEEIKSKIENLMTLSDDATWMGHESTRETVKIKAQLLEVMTLNEINWSLYYLKEEMKNLKSEMKNVATIVQRK